MNKTADRPDNGNGKFVLPAAPADTSAPLQKLIAEYRAGFVVVSEEEHHRWPDAARLIHAFEPASLPDLAAKLIVAIHYRDPELAGDALAIRAPKDGADRLAIEMELRCLDWLFGRPAPEPDCRWTAALPAYTDDRSALDGLCSEPKVNQHQEWRSAVSDWQRIRDTWNCVGKEFGRAEQAYWNDENPRTKGVHDRLDALNTEWMHKDDDALRRIIATPAPDIEAVIYKMRLGQEHDLPTEEAVIADLVRLTGGAA